MTSSIHVILLAASYFYIIGLSSSFFSALRFKTVVDKSTNSLNLYHAYIQLPIKPTSAADFDAVPLPLNRLNTFLLGLGIGLGLIGSRTLVIS